MQLIYTLSVPLHWRLKVHGGQTAACQKNIMYFLCNCDLVVFKKTCPVKTVLLCGTTPRIHINLSGHEAMFLYGPGHHVCKPVFIITLQSMGYPSIIINSLFVY